MRPRQFVNVITAIVSPTRIRKLSFFFESAILLRKLLLLDRVGMGCSLFYVDFELVRKKLFESWIYVGILCTDYEYFNVVFVVKK